MVCIFPTLMRERPKPYCTGSASASSRIVLATERSGNVERRFVLQSADPSSVAVEHVHQPSEKGMCCLTSPAFENFLTCVLWFFGSIH